jgi:hypothetical protein
MTDTASHKLRQVVLILEPVEISLVRFCIQHIWQPRNVISGATGDQYIDCTRYEKVNGAKR